MSKYVKPLSIVAALLFVLGFNTDVFAIDENDAEAAANIIIENVAVPAVNTVTTIVNEDNKDILSQVVSTLVNNPDFYLASDRPKNTLLGGGSNQFKGLAEDAYELVLVSGQTETVSDGGTAVTVAPLVSDGNDGCVVCHTDYASLDGTTIVGGVVVSIDYDE